MLAIRTLREFTENIPAAWAEGTNAKLLNPIPYNEILPSDEYFFFGILRGSGELYQRCQKYGYNFYYADHAYFFNKNFPKNSCYRITKNSHVNYKIQDRPNDRYIKFRSQKTKPWKNNGSHILICPPSIFIQAWQQRFDWLHNTVQTIKKNTDRKIIIREKQHSSEIIKKANFNLPLINEEYSEKSLNDDLRDAWCVVTYNSMVSLNSLIEGVPLFSDSKLCAAFNLSEQDFSKIEEPYYPPNRDELFNSLAYSQFTLDEMRSGYAFKILNNLI